MTREEFDKLPAEIKHTINEKGIILENITNLELGAGAFGEVYIKRIDLYPYES